MLFGLDKPASGTKEKHQPDSFNPTPKRGINFNRTKYGIESQPIYIASNEGVLCVFNAFSTIFITNTAISIC